MMHGARHFGYEVSDVSFDWATIKGLRDAYVRKLNGIYLSNVEKAGVTLITGFAAFVGPKTVQVGWSALCSSFMRMTDSSKR